MAPTTFDELVAHQKEVSAGLQKDHGANKAFSDKVVEKFGIDWGEDLEGLRWRAQCVQRFDELSREIVEKDAEVRREKEVTAEIGRTRARNMAEFEEIMKLIRDAVADDPWMLRGLKEIIEAHPGEDGAVVGEKPDLKAMELSIGRCCSGLEELREEMSEKYESEISNLMAQVRRRDEQIQARDQEIGETRLQVQGLERELGAQKSLVSSLHNESWDDSVEEQMAAARERYHVRESLRQEVLRADRLQREVDAGRATCRSLRGLNLGLTDEVGALLVELETVRHSERSAMVLVGSEQRRLGQEVEKLRGRMAGMRVVFDREISIWVQKEEGWSLEKSALGQQRQSAFDALAALEREKEDVEIELAGVGDQLFRSQTELGEMASSVDWLADGLAGREDLIRRGWALLRASLWVVQVLRAWGGYLWWLVAGAWMVIGARDAQIAVLAQRNGRLGAAVLARDARIGVMTRRIGELTGEVGAANARILALSGQVEKLWRGLSESRKTSAGWLAGREELLHGLGARDARIKALEERGGELEVDLLWESCPLVGLNPREVVAKGGTPLSVALEEWERSQVAGEGKSLAECVQGAGRVIPTMDGGWICGHGESLLVVGREVVVVPFEDYRVCDGSWHWVTMEYGNPRVALRIANGETKPMDEMFPAAMARYAAEPME